MARRKKDTRKKGKPIDLGVLKNRKLWVITASVLMPLSLVVGVYYFFTNSHFFDVKEIIVNKEGIYSLSEAEQRIRQLYLNRNIFTIDLGQIPHLAIREFPYLKRVEARRSLPDRLEMDFFARRPVAFIEAGEPIVIDKEAVVLPREIETGGLIRIKGITYFFRSPNVGENIMTGVISKALVLADALMAKEFIRKHDVESIDISDRRNIVLNIDGLEVKMGHDNFAWKINKLNDILEDRQINIKDINYIDLRFEKAVISPK